MAKQSLKIEGARENNLKDISLEIPHDQVVVVTGLSGSGKSSLAFDTVYAEGQRRYIETFSPYTRQFFDKVKRPDVDRIEEVRPAIAIEQRTRITNSRSTVGTVTNLNDLLKIVWSNLAAPVCPQCGVAVQAWTAASLTKHLQHIIPIRAREGFLLVAPFPLPQSAKKSEDERQRLLTLGFSRYFDETKLTVEKLEHGIPKTDTLLVVIDRFRSSAISPKRLQESTEQAFAISSEATPGNGICSIIELTGNSVQAKRPLATVLNGPGQPQAPRLGYTALSFTEKPSCLCAKLDIPKARPALFTFNHPLGACPECKGFGFVLKVDPARCVPEDKLSIKKNALQCWSGPAAQSEYRRLLKFCEANKIPTNVPWATLPPQQRDSIFNAKTKEYRGVAHWFKRLESKAYKMYVRVFLAKYRSQFICTECKGNRLKSGALAYRINGKTIADIWRMPLVDLKTWFSAVAVEHSTRSKLPREISETFATIQSRINCLVELGLPYLTLDRQARTLSGGETQRVNLATALGSNLVSTHFVLDEPSVGLHPRDSSHLIHAVHALCEQGNSLLVVEHDPDFIYKSEHVVEIGPNAGAQGGEIVYNGSTQKWPGLPSLPATLSSTRAATRFLKVHNARARNLKNITLDIPLDRLVCLTGVSGSGKSSLVSEVLLASYHAQQNSYDISRSENFVAGFDQVEQVLMVDQSPLAKSPRANIATYTGMWDRIRELLAQSDDATQRALSKSNFSFNVEGGRCPACKGAGFITEEMQFLSDVYIPCDLCLGKRFQPAVLEVRCRGRNVHEILSLSVSECRKLFADETNIAAAASTLEHLGLGHLTLGHPLSALSGGEAQRLKLVPFISQSHKGRSLLIFDEPTTGLHVRDTANLISLFKDLVTRGHSVLCVEHNLQVMYAADWLIDLGPEGGSGGGQLLAAGSPALFLEDKLHEVSYTARALRSFKQQGNKAPVVKPTQKKRVAHEALQIRGAREHNLQNINLDVPLYSFVAITGVSGSGKSSIAKDIIYSEGQRRYLDCLSPYARQFIKELKRPEVDSVENVQPTICVYQHTFQPGRLSTVGTMSEAYNFLRLLYAKVGTQYCPDHPDRPITPLSPKEMAIAIKSTKESSLRILAPIIKIKKGNHKAVLERARQSDVVEVRIDGIFLKPSTLASMSGGLERNKVHSIDFVIAKFNPQSLDLQLLEEVVSQGLALGGGVIIAHTGGEERIFSLERACPVCHKGFFKPDPEELSFHSRRGACSHCSGSGLDDDSSTCRQCHGTRLTATGQHIRLREKNIAELSALPPTKILQFIEELDLTQRAKTMAEPILQELRSKLTTLMGIGIDYLPLARDCRSLSNGELQRLRLATAIGSPLTGVMYIFDEPSVGLHPQDNLLVLTLLRQVCKRGNSVLMIEHDLDSIRSADYVIEVGPGGGKHGGQIVFTGNQAELLLADTDTARAIREERMLVTTTATPPLGILAVRKASRHCIRSISIDIQLGNLVVIAGVSGAGKSTLVHGIVADTITLGQEVTVKRAWKSAHATISSTLEIERVLLVDQKPIGINSRSTPASYLGIWDDIRNLFASSVESKARGWKPSFFSYNTGSGRCPDCKGQGAITLEMSFLADAQMPCEACGGSRYTDDALSVRYLGLSIAEVLGLTFEEAKQTFANHRRIHQTLQQACELGLGYLSLGQSSSTLSGGESQRIKLVSELSSPRQGHTLYLLDEPTTGLHKADVLKLIKILRSLVSKGNTVLLIEHDPAMLLEADQIIEMGPGPGERGGKVVFTGSSAELLRSGSPWSSFLIKSKGQSYPALKKMAEQSP
jgi:excinuclease ABC subunit A